MKRLIIPGLALLAIAALGMWGNRILEHTLDAELPKLLSRELGIPVSLGPTKTRITTLTVRSPRLVMGDPASPALVANRVSVSLNWSDLLHGEIRLRRATGTTLIVNPSLWPGNDDPWPTDYRFLDPYLPDYIALDSARYIGEDDHGYTFIQPEWRRKSPGASLSWRDDRDGQAADITVGLNSLDDLLRLARLSLQITSVATGKDHSTVAMALEMQPGKQSGYSLTARIEGAGMTAGVVTGNTSAWELPDQSSTSIKLLDIGKLQALVESYGSDTKSASPEEMLALPLPRLSLPEHKGHVTIDEIRWQDEVSTNSVFDFITGAEGVSIPALSSEGPEGVLHGQLSISSSDSGWLLGLEAELAAAETGQSLAAPYLDADWFWREGSGKVKGQGKTWGALLNSLQGDIALSGSHHGAVETPIAITARLDNRPGEFALDMIDVKLAKGRITGSAALSGDEQKRLTGKIRAEQLNLDFLLPESGPAAARGIEVPTYLEFLPGVDLDWQLDIIALTVSQFNIPRTSITYARTPEKATLTAHAKGDDESTLELQLAASMFPDKPSEVTLRSDFSRFSIARLFQQAPVILDSRTSGTISFSGRGHGVEQIFKAMRGKADLSIDHRPDNDWKRPPTPEELLRVTGDAVLVIDNKMITGLQISELAIDSPLQNLSGSVSIVEGRKPWLEADLTSDSLDLASLAKFKPQGAADGSPSDSLDSLRKLAEGRITFNAKSVLVANVPLSKVALQVSTAPNSIKIEQLDFSVEQGRLTSEGGISWLTDKAALALDARVDDISLDKLLADAPSAASAPLSGTVSLRSTGDTVSSLLADLTGDIRLTTSPGSGSVASGARGQVEMTARQTANGMHAVIHRFLWEDTDLSGSVLYRDTTPPLLEVEISGGSLSLLSWEAGDTKPEGDVVVAPLRPVSGPREAEPGKKLFSTTPLPLDWLNKYQARVKGRLDKLTSREATASDLTFSGSLISGELTVEASAGTLNGVSASGKFNLDTAQSPAALALSGTFKDLQGGLIKASFFPRSGYFNVTSRGSSQAEVAGNVNGLVYLELGAGPLDYSKMVLLTADVATSFFETLIPGVDKEPPQLECGVTLGVFKDGIGNTPYGYAVRTDQANLVGQIEIDLKKELLHMNFSSSSRKGVGISVGDVYSHTVEVEGPLTNPEIIPNATGLLAAVLTAGLSIVSESVLKRALSSENPCVSVQKHIRENFCGTGDPATASPMVCPPA